MTETKEQWVERVSDSVANHFKGGIMLFPYDFKNGRQNVAISREEAEQTTSIKALVQAKIQE